MFRPGPGIPLWDGGLVQRSLNPLHTRHHLGKRDTDRLQLIRCRAACLLNAFQLVNKLLCMCLEAIDDFLGILCGRGEPTRGGFDLVSNCLLDAPGYVSDRICADAKRGYDG